MTTCSKNYTNGKRSVVYHWVTTPDNHKLPQSSRILNGKIPWVLFRVIIFYSVKHILMAAMHVIIAIQYQHSLICGSPVVIAQKAWKAQEGSSGNCQFFNILFLFHRLILIHANHDAEISDAEISDAWSLHNNVRYLLNLRTITLITLSCASSMLPELTRASAISHSSFVQACSNSWPSSCTSSATRIVKLHHKIDQGKTDLWHIIHSHIIDVKHKWNIITPSQRYICTNWCLISAHICESAVIQMPLHLDW